MKIVLKVVVLCLLAFVIAVVQDMYETGAFDQDNIIVDSPRDA